MEKNFRAKPACVQSPQGGKYTLREVQEVWKAELEKGHDDPRRRRDRLDQSVMKERLRNSGKILEQVCLERECQVGQGS